MLNLVTYLDLSFEFQNTQIFWTRILGFHNDDPAMNYNNSFEAKAKNLLWFCIQLC